MCPSRGVTTDPLIVMDCVISPTMYRTGISFSESVRSLRAFSSKSDTEAIIRYIYPIGIYIYIFYCVLERTVDGKLQDGRSRIRTEVHCTQGSKDTKLPQSPSTTSYKLKSNKCFDYSMFIQCYGLFSVLLLVITAREFGCVLQITTHCVYSYCLEYLGVLSVDLFSPMNGRL